MDDKKKAVKKADDEGFSKQEKEAMKERAKELKRAKSKADDEQAVLAKIEEMNDADQAIAQSLHVLVKKEFSQLGCKTWYGMPAYTKEGKVVLFFQAGGRFDSRYSTLGFSDSALLDEGDFWPTSFALVKWTKTVENKVAALIRKAVA